MLPIERRAAYSLASLFSLRMLGLFMILPVFALYAEHLGDVTPTEIGLAIGIYGLTQAAMQIPFGMLSDHYGRKPIIILGLLVFALGSVIAANADSIFWVIIGRAVQGSGAIAAVIMAAAADLSREDHRAKIMGVIGVSIGFAFAAAMVIGPVLNGFVGVPGIFWVTAFLSLVGIVIVRFWVPSPQHTTFHRDAESQPSDFRTILKNEQLQRLDFGIFTLHMILTASFIALPFVLRDFVHIDPNNHSYVYLPVLILALAVMIPFVIIAEKKRKLKEVFCLAIAGICVSELAFMAFHESLTLIVVTLFLFFLFFNVLEALLPSLIAKIAPPDKKGTAMGVYSTSQFLGAFSGGIVGGWAYENEGVAGVFLLNAVMAAVWFAVAVSMKKPSHLRTFLIYLGETDEAKARVLSTEIGQESGVAEVVVVVEDGIAYLKIDSQVADIERLNAYSVEHDL